MMTNEISDCITITIRVYGKAYETVLMAMMQNHVCGSVLILHKTKPYVFLYCLG